MSRYLKGVLYKYFITNLLQVTCQIKTPDNPSVGKVVASAGSSAPPTTSAWLPCI